MIKSIYLENWKTHDKTQLQFSKGSNIIVGKIGSGKSSIIEAICYALFGNNSGISKTKIAHKIMLKPVKKDYAKIVLELETQDNKNYKIERKITSDQTSNSAKLYLNDKLVAGPKQTDVNEMVAKILGIDYDLFSEVVYAEQNQMDSLLKLQPAKRKEKFDDIFGINLLEKMNKNINEIKKSVLNNQNTQNKLIESIDKQISNIDYDKYSNDKQNSLTKLNLLEKEIDLLLVKLNTISSKFKELESKKQKHSELFSKKNILQSNINDLNIEIDNLKSDENPFLNKNDLDNIKQKHEEKLKLLQQQYNLQNTIKSEINFISNQLNDLQKEMALQKTNLKIKDINLLCKDITKLEQQIITLTKEKKENDAFNTALKIEINSLKNKKELLEKNNVEFQTKIKLLKSQLFSSDKTIEQITSIIETLNKNVEQLKNKQMYFLLDKDAITKAIEDLKKTKTSCPVCETPLSEDKKELLINKKQVSFLNIDGALKDTTKVLSEKKNVLQKQLQLLEKLNNNSNLNQDIISFSQKVEHNLKLINEYNHLILEKEKALKNLPLLDSTLEDLSLSLTSLNKNKVILENYNKNKEKSETLLKQKDEKLASLKQEVSEEHLVLLKKDIDKIISAITHNQKLKQKQNKQFFLNEVISQLDSLNYDEKEYLNLYSEKDNINENLNNKKTLKNMVLGTLNDINKNLSSYNNLKTEKESYEKTLQKLNTSEKDLLAIFKAISSTQKQLRKMLVSEINKALNIIWPKIYAYNDYTALQLNANDDYQLEVLSLENKWIPVLGFLSGGEMACVAISLRVAISLILTKNLGLFILDEPTHNMDKKTINNLKDIIEQQLPSLVDQIFIITHDEHLLETKDTNIFKIDRDKESDGTSLIKNL